MLSGFGIQGWRSFGPKPQFLGPFSKVNIFAGLNNVGKSNILRTIGALRSFATNQGRKKETDFSDSPLTRHIGAERALTRLFLPIPASVDQTLAICEQIIPKGVSNRGRYIQALQRVIQAIADHKKTDPIWFEYDPNGNLDPISPTTADMLNHPQGRIVVGTEQDWYHAWSALTNSSSPRRGRTSPTT